MLDLEELAKNYLQSEGFQILDQSDGCIVSQRLEFGGNDIQIVQTMPPRKSPSRMLMDKVLDIRSNYPDARATILAHSREGISREFNAELSAEKIRVVVPVQFFDAPFKVETAPRTSSLINDIRNQAESEVRIPQQYEIDGVDEGGTDLFNTLLRELTIADGPNIRFVIGRAGVGKSYLFRALFQRLYSDFMNSKRGQRIHPRPIPLLPEHLRGYHSTRIEHLIQNFLHDEIVSPIQPDTFAWLLTNGFSTWLLDGLDELYAGEETFFDDIFNFLGEIGSRAQIIIWCRDSLLTSSQSFAEFLEFCTGLDIVTVYKLTGWERQHKRLYAWYRTNKRRPKPQEDDPKEVSSFLTALEKNPTLKSLSALPFYCELIFNRIDETGIPRIRDDVELLNFVIDDTVQREKEKGLLKESDFEQDGLEVWMEEIAAESVDGKGYADIAQVRELGELVLREDLSNERSEEVLQTLVQFPLFASSEEGTGRIAFAHELIAQALTARFCLREIGRKRERSTVFDRLTNVDLNDPVLLRFVASRVSFDMTKFILSQLQNARVSDAAFRVVLFLIMLIRPERDLIKRENLQFAGKNLTGVSFESRDLSGHSFVECNLSQVLFKNCDLHNASFEGAFLSNTGYMDCKLNNARFGNISRIESVSFGGTVIHDTAAIRKKIYAETGMTLEVIEEPCPTALQVVRLFTKFVTPLGEARRKRLDKRGLLAGRRIEGAAPSSACVHELLQSGYLTGPDNKDRYSRSDGEIYREIVEAVRDGTLSDGIVNIVGGLCSRTGCAHQLN